LRLCAGWLLALTCRLALPSPGRIAARRTLRTDSLRRHQAARQNQRNRKASLHFVFPHSLDGPFDRTLRSIQRNLLPRKASHTRIGLIIQPSTIHTAGRSTTNGLRKDARIAEHTGRRRFSTPRRPPRNDTIHY
jgi:hypothetical protein